MKKLVVVLALAWVAAGIGAVYLWLKLADLRDQKASLLTHVEALEKRAPATATSAPQVQSAGTTGNTVAPGAASAPVASAAQPNQQSNDMMRTMMRSTMERMLPDLDVELGLAPNELDKLLDLLAEQRGNGNSGEKEVAAMLGSRYPQWQEYQKTLPARVQVNQLRGQLAASGSTLPESQARPLMTALNAELQRIDQESMQEPRSRNMSPQELREAELQHAGAQYSRMVEAAKPYLNAQQLESFRQMLDQQKAFVSATLQSMDAAEAAVQSKTR